MTRDEILRKIAQVEQKEDDFNLFIRNLKNEEEHQYGCLIEENKLFDYRFEDCKEDRELVNLLDEDQMIHQNLQRLCSDFICELDELQKKNRYECELEIEELRRQLKGLEV